MEKTKWAVHRNFIRGWEIHKIISEDDYSIKVLNKENQTYLKHSWNKNLVHVFQRRIDAINYSLNNQDKRFEYGNFLCKKEIIKKFLKDFPSEKENLKKEYVQDITIILNKLTRK
jgi:hypothetical protein